MIIGAMSVSIAVTPWAIDITGTKTHCNKRKSDYYLVLFKPLFHLFVFYWLIMCVYYKNTLPSWGLNVRKQKKDKISSDLAGQFLFV